MIKFISKWCFNCFPSCPCLVSNIWYCNSSPLTVHPPHLWYSLTLSTKIYCLKGEACPPHPPRLSRAAHIPCFVQVGRGGAALLPIAYFAFTDVELLGSIVGIWMRLVWSVCPLMFWRCCHGSITVFSCGATGWDWGFGSDHRNLRSILYIHHYETVIDHINSLCEIMRESCNHVCEEGGGHSP